MIVPSMIEGAGSRSKAKTIARKGRPMIVPRMIEGVGSTGNRAHQGERDAAYYGRYGNKSGNRFPKHRPRWNTQKEREHEAKNLGPKLEAEMMKCRKRESVKLQMSPRPTQTVKQFSKERHTPSFCKNFA